MLRNRLSLLTLIGMLIVSVGCSLWSNTESFKSDVYKLTHLPAGWNRLAPEGSDHAFENPQTNSIITINSLCKRYESTSLKQLTYNILGGLDDTEIEEAQVLHFNSRDALRTKSKARIDGVPVYLIIQTTRKNNCIYDFLLISTSEQNRETDQQAFNELLTGINIP